MNILHIVNGFSNSKVHSNLIRELDKLGINQVVFNPIRVTRRNTIGKNEFQAAHTQFVYADVVRPFHHYFYHIRRRCVFKELLKRVDVSEINLVHASTLMTDGGVAYKLYQKYRIPYVVAVRNTDINIFLDKMPHTWHDAKKILINAKRIFFISQGLKQKFENNRMVKPFLSSIKDKFVLIPNGIDDYYISNVQYDKKTGHRIIYIGDFSRNKNVLRLGEAILQLRKEERLEDITLTIVGGGNNEDDSVEKMIDAHPEVFKYAGIIYDKSKICELLREHKVFAMPSINETFGLVYLEALSQNLPVLYTKGQGIDGLFDNKVGIAVNPLSVPEISDALKKMLLDDDYYCNKTVDFDAFQWPYIAKKYREHYRNLLGFSNLNQNLLSDYIQERIVHN